MNMYAGIALGRITENAPFCCTRFKGSEDNNSLLLVGPFNPSPATEHTLISDVPEEIVSSIPDLETAARKMAFTLSYPITTSKAHRKAFEAMDRYCHDHCTAFLSACEFGMRKSEDIVEMVFIDLTPGQVAAMVTQGMINEGRWSSKKVRKKVTLGNVDKLSVQKVVDELITPLAPNWSIMQCVGILRPEGAFPELLPIKMELQFINIPLKWLSLADLSNGSATLLYHELASEYHGGFRRRAYSFSYPPWYIKLADGSVISMLGGPRHGQSQDFFTTSKDYQATITLRLSRWDKLYEIRIKRLAPKLKGALRIKVMMTNGAFSRPTTVTVQESSSNLNVNLILSDAMAIEITGRPETGRRPIFGMDGVIGELPE